MKNSKYGKSLNLAFSIDGAGYTTLTLNLFDFTITEFIGEIIMYDFKNNFRRKVAAFKH